MSARPAAQAAPKASALWRHRLPLQPRFGRSSVWCVVPSGIGVRPEAAIEIKELREEIARLEGRA